MKYLIPFVLAQIGIVFIGVSIPVFIFLGLYGFISLGIGITSTIISTLSFIIFYIKDRKKVNPVEEL